MPQGPEEEKWLVEYSLQAQVTGVSWELSVYLVWHRQQVMLE